MMKHMKKRAHADPDINVHPPGTSDTNNATPLVHGANIFKSMIDVKEQLKTKS